MGLDMKMKKKLSEETAKRYCTASKKHKTKIIDEFVANTGYNRKYAIHITWNTKLEIIILKSNKHLIHGDWQGIIFSFLNTNFCIWKSICTWKETHNNIRSYRIFRTRVFFF